MANKKKDTSIEDTLQMLQEEMVAQFGDNAAVRLSSSDVLSNITEWVSTGSLVVDKVLAGGRPMPCSLFPFGRQTEIAGLPMAGKTTLCAQIAAATQRAGGIVVTTDTEDRIDKEYWAKLGVDNSKVLSVGAHTIEDVFERQEFMLRTLWNKSPDQKILMIWDSIGATSSADVLEGTGSFMERAKKMYGREAKLIGTGVKALSGLIAKSNIGYLYTNHLYKKMDVKHGDPWETYGGNKLQFLATVRLRLTKYGDITVEDALGNKAVIGQHVRIKAVKNSMGPKRLDMESVILGGVGFSDDYTVFEVGKKLKLITTAGSWSTANLGEERIKYQGWKGFQEKVIPHPKYNELLNSVMEAL